MHTIIPIFLFIPFIVNLCTAQNGRCNILDYSSSPAEECVAGIRTDLASKDPARRDCAIMCLSLLINNERKSPKEHNIILKLIADKEVINVAAEIVADRLAGWYEERGEGREMSMALYYPLIYLLSLSQSKTAGVTLLMALPVVGFDDFFRKSVYTNELVLKSFQSKLLTIENKLCCFYPGRDPICDMQAIDLRIAMLDMYLEAARSKRSVFVSNDMEMKKFVSGCLVFGDVNKGRIIRKKAVEIACLLIKAGHIDFLPVVKKIAASDPCYLYKAGPEENNFLPQFDITGKYYPVREIALKVLSQLSGS